jgi:hypothetical protein
MKARWLLTAVLMALLVVPLPSQGGGGGTRLDEFGRKLRLHPENQMPALQQIFNEGAQAAAPVAQEMLQLRQTLLNLTLANRTADIPAARAAYTEAATKMTGVEVAVYQKVFALLQPSQKSRTPDAFAFMAGFFQTSPTRGGRGGRSGGAQ